MQDPQKPRKSRFARGLWGLALVFTVTVVLSLLAYVPREDMPGLDHSNMPGMGEP